MRVRMLAATAAVVALLLTGCTPAAESETDPPVTDDSIITEDGAQDEAVEVEEEVAAEGPAGGVVYADPTSDATQIIIGPDGFSPGSPEIAVGGTVTFTGQDDGPHGIIIGDLDGYSVMGGLTASFRFDKPGTYRVVDEITEHETTVVVK